MKINYIGGSPLIWTRALSPKEALDSTSKKNYREIGIRSHIGSDQVGADHARFSGIILEENITVHPEGGGLVTIKPKTSLTNLGEATTTEQIITIIRKAHSEGLPCFIT